MRRKDREITDSSEIEKIIEKADICRLGLSQNNLPYIVPLNFGYKDHCFYFHCAKEGKKIDIIKDNPNVCFELDIDTKIVSGDIACKWTMSYKSVMGRGTAMILEESVEKQEGLNIIMEHYSGKGDYEYTEAMRNRISVIKVEINEMTGKKSGY